MHDIYVIQTMKEEKDHLCVFLQQMGEMWGVKKERGRFCFELPFSDKLPLQSDH